MVQHPWGHMIEIFSIESPTNGYSCEEHAICGSVIQDNVVVQLRKVHILIEGKEETAIAAFWVSDGVDRCRVGYLPKFHVRYWNLLEGALAQIIEVYHQGSDSPTKRQKCHRNSGCAVAALISPPMNSSSPHQFQCRLRIITKRSRRLVHVQNVILMTARKSEF